jgi:hypothetical protein
VEAELTACIQQNVHVSDKLNSAAFVVASTQIILLLFSKTPSLYVPNYGNVVVLICNDLIWLGSSPS